MLLGNHFFSVFRTSARGMEAQRIAMGTAAENIANAGTTRTADGGPYALKRAVHEAPEGADGRLDGFGTAIATELRQANPRHSEGTLLRRRTLDAELGPQTEVQEELRTRLEYDPAHPHANAAGYVEYPDVNVVEEMAHMISANRIYEANLTAVAAAKEMIKRTLEI